MKKIVQWIPVLIFMLCFTNTLFAQTENNSIKGKVKTADGQPAEFVSITLVGTNKATTANAQGEYELTNIKPGTYNLKIFFVGLETKEQKVAIRGNETTVVPEIVLNEDSKQLGEVIVKGSWNKFAQRKSDYIARMPIKPLENSQVYNTVTKELAQEQLATDFKSVLKNAAGISGASTQQPTLGRSQLMIRGFYQIFTLKNGMYVNSNFAPDPITIEKLDIVKGPSATLFGAAGFGMSYGGFVNQQTKKPYEKPGGEVGYSGGSYGLNRFTADINEPLNESKTALFRLNTALVSENNFKNYGYNKSYTINPSFLFKVTDKLTVRAELDVQYNKRAGNTSISPIGANVTAKNWKNVGVDYYSTYGSDDIPSVIKYSDIYLQAEYKISSTWKSQTNFMMSSFNVDLRSIIVNLLTDSTIRRRGGARIDHNSITTNMQQNFIGDFKIGQFRNRLLVGGDYTGGSELKQSFYGSTFNIDTVNYLQKKEQPISHYDFDAKAAVAGFDNYGGRFRSNIYGLYVCDLFNIADNLLVMAGLRYDMYRDNTGVDIVGNSNYPDNSQNTFSPKFGIIYQPLKDRVSIFANYQNGFTNQFGTDKNGKRFTPEQANQKEFGVKAELSKGLSGSLSYYDITVKDVLRTDLSDPNFAIQDGTQNNKGIEADVIYNPLPGLNMLIGYGNLKSRYVKSDAGVEGKKPANTANNVANFWISYIITKGKSKGLGAGFGGNYTSEAYADDANTFIIPAYSLFDATVFYNDPKFRVGIKVNNVANTKSWNSFGSQALRQFVANLTVKF